MVLDKTSLARQVQRNCHIADARHGTDFGLCTYLMKMREYYRWEKGLSYTDSLDKDAVGDWLSEREKLWHQLREEDFSKIRIDSKFFDPFDAESINESIKPDGLLYSAGLVNAGRAQFFLTELDSCETEKDGFELLIGRLELARGLHAPPAMTRGRSIFLRRNSLKQSCWEKYESWLWNRPQNAMARALSSYPFDNNLELALEQMTAAEMAVIRAHEIGEFRVGQKVGEDWEKLLLAVLGTPAELMLRAVRDHWADCIETLPMLISTKGREASMHVFIGNLGHMRKAMAPGLISAYDNWLEGDSTALDKWITRGTEHWGKLARLSLDLFEKEKDNVAKRLSVILEPQAI
tara:strand:- start:294 stop:1340 length:1047 start_codon:yes stop_codon:yes gene_type:complete